MQMQEYSNIKTSLNHQKQSQIRIATCTWNLHGDIPPSNSVKKLMDHLIDKLFQNETTDILLIATQQCQNSLVMSMFCQDKKQWENSLKQSALNYTLVETNQLVGLHSAVLVKKSCVNEYLTRRKCVYRAGTCNMFGNKGAISILMNFRGQDLQFINCHLAPHQGGFEKRNQVLINLCQTFVQRDHRKQVVLCGDLNYRIQMEKQFYTRSVASKQNTQKQMQYSKKLNDDQLINQQILKQKFLPYFKQYPIKFPPTYKISPNAQKYNNERIPGWTDRIFHRIGRIKQTNYQCLYKLYGSDHRPVIGSFLLLQQQGLSVLDQDLKWKSKNNNSCQLI